MLNLYLSYNLINYFFTIQKKGGFLMGSIIIKLDIFQTLALSVLVLGLGEFLRKKVNFLEKFCIPSPVIGGLLFSFLTLAGYASGMFQIAMDMSLKNIFMTAFFTTIGFTASFKLLKKGGLQVVIFLGAAVSLVILQDIVGVSLAKLLDLNPLIGLCTASIPMTGGHATAGAFARDFEAAGITGAVTIGMASATFGLIMGSFIGGPIGKSLISKFNLDKDIALNEASITSDNENNFKHLIKNNFVAASSQIILAMGLGTLISNALSKLGLTFPSYIGAMFAAAIFRNISDSTGKFEIHMEEVDIFGSISLSLYLSMALMELKLWELSGLAGPLVILLGAQTILMGLFAYFVTFRVMGKDYEAAVISCGHCGFGMGATPNAMANMNSLSSKYAPAPKAFFILPLVGSLFIDFFNAMIITGFVHILA